jgi:hypothetical protein
MFAITGLMYGTQYFQGPDKPLYHRGLVTMIAVVGAGAFLVIVQDGIYWFSNRRVRAKNASEPDETKHERLYVL